MTDATEVLRAIATHLEFLGYTVTEDEARFRAVHEKYWNFSYASSVGGVLVRAFISVEPGADRNDLNALCGALNADAVVSRFYIDSDGDFCIEAWWPRYYERALFGGFIEAWHHDGALISKQPNSRELLA